MNGAHISNGYLDHGVNIMLVGNGLNDGFATTSIMSCSSPSSETSLSDSKTNLIVNYLPQNMSQEEVRSLFSSMGEIESCKLIRDKVTGQSLGYAFINYIRAEEAIRAVSSLNGLRLQNKTIKVSFARPSNENIKGANLYVSGIPKNMTQPELEAMFRPFGHIITSRILCDNITGLSKGVGFVRFDKKPEAEIAIEKLNNSIPLGCSEPISVKFANNPAATHQKVVLQMAQAASALLPLAVLQQTAAAAQAIAGRRPNTTAGPIHHTPQVGRFRYSPLAPVVSNPATAVLPTQADLLGANMASYLQAAAAATGTNLLQATSPQMSNLTQPMLLGDPAPSTLSNTATAIASTLAASSPGWCIFVYNLTPETDDSVLWRLFGPFGAVLSVKIMKDSATNKCKGYAFITMAQYEEALAAISALNGTQLNGRNLQISFKRA